MKKNTIVAVVIVLVAVLGGWYFVSKDKTSDSGKSAVSTVKEFTITGSNFIFEPSTLSVNKGDTVKITLKTTDGLHDLRIDEFNVATTMLKAGGEETITFVADKSGTFEYYCSVGTHRAMGMKGTLTVN